MNSCTQLNKYRIVKYTSTALVNIKIDKYVLAPFTYTPPTFLIIITTNVCLYRQDALNQTVKQTYMFTSDNRPHV